MCASTQSLMRAGTFDKGRAEQQVGAARAEVDALKGTAYVLRTHITTVQDLLGISEDLSAEGLLVKASTIEPLRPLRLFKHHDSYACICKLAMSGTT